eukprot:314470_1
MVKIKRDCYHANHQSPGNKTVNSQYQYLAKHRAFDMVSILWFGTCLWFIQTTEMMKVNAHNNAFYFILLELNLIAPMALLLIRLLVIIVRQFKTLYRQNVRSFFVWFCVVMVTLSVYCFICTSFPCNWWFLLGLFLILTVIAYVLLSTVFDLMIRTLSMMMHFDHVAVYLLRHFLTHPCENAFRMS